MLIATRTFTTTLDGESLTITAGRDAVDAEHELAKRYPENFAPANVTDPATNGRAIERLLERMTERTPSRRTPRLDLADELRVRSERLAEIDQRQRAVPSRSTDATDSFWLGVDRLLEETNPQRARERLEERESAAMLDELDEARAQSVASEVGELSAWLDRP